MKKLLILVIGFGISINLQSQNYIPLLIDSSYNWSTPTIFEGDTIENEYWQAYSYDPNDRLIQLRQLNLRISYLYGIDTVYSLSESFKANNTWEVVSRGTSIFDGGKIISKLTEAFIDDAFVNSALYTYKYQNTNLDTLYLLQHWANGVWVNFYKKEKVFDTQGNNTEEAEYYVDSNGDFDYNRGKLFEYDNSNNLVQEISINSSVNGEYFTRKVNWFYGDDDLLDTIKVCDYPFPNNGTCNNKALFSYDYKGQDTIIENRFWWENNSWIYTGKLLTFPGPGVYSDRPDSSLYFHFWADSLIHVPTNRRILQYKDLGNDRIYFKEETYIYNMSTDEWLLSFLTEEWYHIKNTVHIDVSTESKKPVSFYPNPCKVGQDLTINMNLSNNSGLEILVFDMEGRLVSHNILLNQTTIHSPIKEGVYSILIREKGQLIGVVKQLIIK